MSILPKLVWHYGEPFADPSAVPTYCVSELARRSVTVALNGDGGDEDFFGYTRYPAVNALQRMDNVPIGLRSFAAKALSALPLLQERKRSRMLEFLQEVNQPSSKRYEFTIAYFSDRDKREGYGEAMAEHLDASALSLLDPYFSEHPDMVAGARWADIHTYLPDDLMVKVDVASMANSLECRSPFLDHVLMEWAMTIPRDVHMGGGETKMLLKKAMEPYLPHEVLYRSKMGFGCPVDHWLRDEIKELAYDTLLSDRCRARGLFSPDYVEKMLDDHCSGAANHHTRLWALLMLELWYSTWIDASQESLSHRPAA
jgi:asparagine synthase (glutamine-hydrolysing)